MKKVHVKVKKVNKNAIIPKYQSKMASGFDIFTSEDRLIPAGETVLIKTGLVMEIPEGFEIQIRPRSGLSLKSNLRIANSPGTIDADYRGEIGIVVENTGDESKYVPMNLRIAQGVIKRVPQAEFEEVETIDNTERGQGGFGSTGK